MFEFPWLGHYADAALDCVVTFASIASSLYEK
jgi:hypothetical protein